MAFGRADRIAAATSAFGSPITTSTTLLRNRSYQIFEKNGASGLFRPRSMVGRMPALKNVFIREAAGFTGEVPKLMRGEAL